LVGTFGIALISFRQIQVTSGWYDQELYHWPTVTRFAQQLPRPDVVHVQTATGPLYHLIAAVLTRTLDLSMEATQFLMGALSWSTLAASLIIATRSLHPACRYLVLVCVFASPYVLQSTLWMMTDALALAL
jgi:hypothetical protein